MADKMMRVAGRGEDGLAKAIRTDENGTIETNIKSNFSAKDYLIGETIVAGGNKYVINSEKISAANLRFTVKTTSSKDFMVRIYHLSDAGTQLGIEDHYFDYDNFISMQVTPRGKKISFRIYNNDTTDMTITVCTLFNISSESSLEKSYTRKPKTITNLTLNANTLNVPFGNVVESRAEYISVGMRGDLTIISKTKIGIRWKFFGGRTNAETLESDIEWLITPEDNPISAPIGQTRMKARKFDIVVLSEINGVLPYVGYTVQGGII